jgi:hypothetical protein
VAITQNEHDDDAARTPTQEQESSSRSSRFVEGISSYVENNALELIRANGTKTRASAGGAYSGSRIAQPKSTKGTANTSISNSGSTTICAGIFPSIGNTIFIPGADCVY